MKIGGVVFITIVMATCKFCNVFFLWPYSQNVKNSIDVSLAERAITIRISPSSKITLGLRYMFSGQIVKVVFASTIFSSTILQEICHWAHFGLRLQDDWNSLVAISAVISYFLSIICICQGTFNTQYFAHSSFLFTRQSPNASASILRFFLSYIMLVPSRRMSVIHELIWAILPIWILADNVAFAFVYRINRYFCLYKKCISSQITSFSSGVYAWIGMLKMVFFLQVSRFEM